MKLRALLAIAAMLAVPLATAQQYRWVDENGGVHYSDTPPPASAKDVQKKRMKGNAVGAQGSYELSEAMKSSPVNQYPSLTLTGSLSIRTAATLNSGMPAIGS